ncbi:hypothetical protein [Rhizohabitans arisaemae]|uniref:hypothetical protein n=1 Tax=Rhizohabitans arisaemae TaxID=2720610 RepID=UPI0024B1DB53|nr:hypothetical protein [Rhizohabitans arisaemae]
MSAESMGRDSRFAEPRGSLDASLAALLALAPSPQALAIRGELIGLTVSLTEAALLAENTDARTAEACRAARDALERLL